MKEKQEIKCFRCSGPYYMSQCAMKKETFCEDGERKVSWVRARIGWTEVNTKSRKQNRELLLIVELNVGGQKVEAIQDSGAEICAYRKDLIPDKFMTGGGQIYLVPEIGRKHKVDLINLPVDTSCTLSVALSYFANNKT